MKAFWRGAGLLARLLLGAISLVAAIGWYWQLGDTQRALFTAWLTGAAASAPARTIAIGGWPLLVAAALLMAFLVARPFTYVVTLVLALLAHQKPLDYAGSIADVGLARMRRGQYLSSELCFRVALAMKLAVAGRRHMGTATTMANLGKNLQRQGRYGASIRWCERANALRESLRGPDDPSLVPTLISLAFTLKAHGRYPEAKQVIDRAVRVARHAERPQLVANTLHQQARILMLTGDLSEAHTVFKKAVAARATLDGGTGPQTASTEFRWGQNYRLRGKYREAAQLQLKAARVLRASGNKAEFNSCLGELCQTLRGQRRPKLGLLIARYRSRFAHDTWGPGTPQSRDADAALIVALRAVNTSESLTEAEAMARQMALLPRQSRPASLVEDA